MQIVIGIEAAESIVWIFLTVMLAILVGLVIATILDFVKLFKKEDKKPEKVEQPQHKISETLEVYAKHYLNGAYKFGDYDDGFRACVEMVKKIEGDK